MTSTLVMYIYIYIYIDKLQRSLEPTAHLIYIYINIVMINGSKISVHRFIATTLFGMIEG